MRSSLCLALGVVAVLTLSSTLPAQTFDPRDISGYWDLTNQGRPAGALSSLSNNRPPMTPWGQEQFAKTRTEFAGAALANRVTAPRAEWNDPTAWCDPPGYPRILWMPETRGMRFLAAPDEIFHFLEFGRTWRELWTDGRKLSPDAEPRWYGYSTARWDGNTLIVNSSGFMEASWLDQYGSPHSDQLQVEERYRLLDRNRLELVVTVTDAKTYTAPWVGTPRIYARVERPRSPFNDLDENLCVWSRERR